MMKSTTTGYKIVSLNVNFMIDYLSNQQKDFRSEVSQYVPA